MLVKAFEETMVILEHSARRELALQKDLVKLLAKYETLRRYNVETVESPRHWYRVRERFA